MSITRLYGFYIDMQISKNMVHLGEYNYFERMVTMEHTVVDAKRIEAVSERVRQAAIDTLGDRLDKVYLYDVNEWGYDGPDFCFLIVADIAESEAGDEHSKIRNRLAHVVLEYDVLFCCGVTGTERFNKYKNVMPTFKSAINEGTLLYGR